MTNTVAAVEPTIQGSLTKFVDVVTATAQSLVEAVVEVSPKALELILGAIRLDAGANLAAGVVFAIGTVVLLSYFTKFSRKADGDNSATFFSFVFGIAAVVLTIVTFHYITVENMIAVVSPEAHLALKALTAAGVR